MKIKKKLQKNMKENVSNTNESVEDFNGGRTIILRDQTGEIIVSSTHDEDTLEDMFKIALKKSDILKIKDVPGMRGYHA